MNLVLCRLFQVITVIITCYVTILQMGGSFHVAPGKSFSLNHIHIHDVHPYSSSSFNLSHVVKHLSFGDRINFANTHPLDGVEVNTKESEYLYRFFEHLF